MADRPVLVPRLAELQWHHWRHEPGGEHLAVWIEANRQNTGRAELPVGFLAVDEQDQVLGGVSLIPTQHAELRGRGPWVHGLVVRPDKRRQGVGALLIEALER